MHARAHLNVFEHELNLEGKVRNLSVGGCLVYVSLEDSMALSANQTLPSVTLEFPNGDTFTTEGRIRHMRPFWQPWLCGHRYRVYQHVGYHDGKTFPLCL